MAGGKAGGLPLIRTQQDAGTFNANVNPRVVFTVLQSMNEAQILVSARITFVDEVIAQP